MILLDTNAVIWLKRNHPRARRLAAIRKRLYVSPATLLEVQFLLEAERLRMTRGAQVSDLIDDDRWVVDSPSSDDWFEAALGFTWTRDPFDRLIAAHAEIRGWILATGDQALIEQLGPHRCFDV